MAETGGNGKDFVVTPWEVSGTVDYDKLVEQFGTQKITDPMLKRVERITGELHFMLRRKIFFSHRDFDWILNRYEAGEKFFLYTGRGPSGHTTLGHVMPWVFTAWLQKKFGAELWFQMTDDEKSLIKDLTTEQTTSFAYENALDVLACGMDPKKTHIFTNLEYGKTIYKQAVHIAKHVTLSTSKAVFGFNDSSNIGITFFPAMQAVPCFLPSVQAGRNIPCLIPAAIDQDPYWRISRDVAPKMGFYKPAQVHCKFIPGLGPGGKMSASEPSSAIFTTDTPEQIERKIANAFTGQQPTKELQRKLGGNPDVCIICQYYYFLFEQDDKKLAEIFEGERTGTLLAGEHKADLAERVKRFIADHQRKREKARKVLDKVMMRD
ncbi:MAG: tryptophan--tRNA ligase [Candidatus Aenigmatarchaeota archaeon]